MKEFLSFETLGTLAGSVSATTVIVEFLKDIGPLKKLHTKCLVFIVAFIITVIAAFGKNSFSLSSISLYVLNSILTSSLSIGSWHLAIKRSGEK